MKMIMDEAHPQIEYCLFITRIDLIERNQYHFRTFDSEPKKIFSAPQLMGVVNHDL